MREIVTAASRIAPHVRRTPILALPPTPKLAVAVILKLEFLQHTGSFKPRGAFNRMLAAGIPPRGVIAASGGNHGAAVAYAAQVLGVAAEIFVPATAPTGKIARISGYGARVMPTGETYGAAQRASVDRQCATGALDVHAYDDPDVLAGQGTVGREFEEQAPELTHVLVAVGGGGLIGGIAAWYAGRAAVIGVEPEACPTLHAALAAGEPVAAPVGGIAADSLGASEVGATMFPIARAHIAQSVLVSDAAIRSTQRLLWETLRIVVEPGGATALAALVSGAFQPPPDARVGVVLCGANTDPAKVVG